MKKLILVLILCLVTLALFGCTQNSTPVANMVDLSKVELHKCNSTSQECVQTDECFVKYALFNSDSSLCNSVTDIDMQKGCVEKKLERAGLNNWGNIEEPFVTVLNEVYSNPNGYPGIKKLESLEFVNETELSSYFEAKAELENSSTENEDMYSDFDSFLEVSSWINRNPSFSINDCSKISNVEGKEWCELIFKKDLNPFYCESLQTLEGECYYFLAVQNKDSSLCAKSKDPFFGSVSSDNTCEDLVVTKIAIDDSSVQKCSEISYPTTDSQYLDYITKYSTYASCVLQVIYKTKDLSECSALDSRDELQSMTLLSIPKYFLQEECSKGEWLASYVSRDGSAKPQPTTVTQLEDCKQTKNEDKCTSWAILYTNSEFCDALAGTSMGEYSMGKCYAAAYAATGSKNFVKTLSYVLLHYTLTSEDLCSILSNPIEKANCFSAIGTYSKNKSYCDKAREENIKLEFTDSLYVKDKISVCYLFSGALEKKDYSVCSYLSKEILSGEKATPYYSASDWSADTKDCFTYYALLNKEPKVCMGINSYIKKESSSSNTTTNVTPKPNASTDTTGKYCSANGYSTENEWRNGKGPIVLDKASHTKLESEIKSKGDSALNDISSLTCLTKLDLYSFGVSDISPLKNLTNLEDLDIRSNSISDLSPLIGLTKLKHLSFSNMAFTDLEGVAKISSLEEITMFDSDQYDFAPLANLKSLKGLAIDKLSSSGAEQLQYIKGISRLFATGLNQTQVDYLKNFLDLNNLMIYTNKDITDYSFLSTIAKLENLSIYMYDYKTEKYYSVLPQLSSLKVLGISDCGDETISIPQLSALKNLGELHIEYCSGFNDSASIYELTNLKSIYLTQTDIQSFDFSKLSKLESVQVYTKYDTLKKQCETYLNEHPEKDGYCETDSY